MPELPYQKWGYYWITGDRRGNTRNLLDTMEQPLHLRLEFLYAYFGTGFFGYMFGYRRQFGFCTFNFAKLLSSMYLGSTETRLNFA